MSTNRKRTATPAVPGDSPVVAEARVELRQITDEMGVLRAKLRWLASQLRRLSRDEDATFLGVHPKDGDRYTVEGWAADSIDSINDDILDEAFDTLEAEVHVDWRAQAVKDLEEETEHYAKRAAQEREAGR